MTHQPGKPDQIIFGHWCFSADAGDLYDGETSTRLEPQVAKLLAFFLANQNKVISRDELISSVWENRVVSDDAINRCVSILRQTLSPDDKQAYIETVVRKGYLAHFPPAVPSQPNELNTERNNRYILPVVLVVLVGIFLYVIIGQRDAPTGEQGRERMQMVAVLPFTSAGQDNESEFFAHGIHNDLLTQLAKLQSMRVISATSVMEYRGVAHNIRKIGEELGADIILEGSVQISGNEIRINAQLINAKTDEHLWAESYDRSLTPASIFDVQGEIARAIVREMKATLTKNDNRQLSLIPTSNMAAYRAFHQAMQIWETRTGGDDTEFIQALEQTLELDPLFTRAWAELVTVLALQNFSGHGPEFTLRAELALQRLEEIAPGSTDHMIGQAVYVYYILKDYNQAHDIISRALSRNPSDTRVIELKSWIERRQGDYDAYVESKRELLRLDPRNPKWTSSLINALLISHRYDEVLAEVEKTTLRSFTIERTRHLMLFREQRDFIQFQQSVHELCQLYQEPNCGWEEHVAARDYPAALNSIDADSDDGNNPFLRTREIYHIFTYFLMRDEASLEQGLPIWKAQLDEGRDESGEFIDWRAHIGSAALSAIQGDTAETIRQIEKWNLYKPVDWAERAGRLHSTCRILGMVTASDAAVKCIRVGLDQASFIIPFWEPYLPYYDAIRNEPEFIEMLLEIDPAGPLTSD